MHTHDAHMYAHTHTHTHTHTHKHAHGQHKYTYTCTCTCAHSTCTCVNTCVRVVLPGGQSLTLTPTLPRTVTHYCYLMLKHYIYWSLFTIYRVCGHHRVSTGHLHELKSKKLIFVSPYVQFKNTLVFLFTLFWPPWLEFSIMALCVITAPPSRPSRGYWCRLHSLLNNLKKVCLTLWQRWGSNKARWLVN